VDFYYVNLCDILLKSQLQRINEKVFIAMDSDPHFEIKINNQILYHMEICLRAEHGNMLEIYWQSGRDSSYTSQKSARARLSASRQKIYRINFNADNEEVTKFRTTYCNLECIMCDHYYQKNSRSQHLDLRIIEKLAPILPKVEQIHLNGGGEVFCNPEIKNIWEIYASYKLRPVQAFGNDVPGNTKCRKRHAVN